MAKDKTNLAGAEAALAFWMLAPAFAIVMAIVVFPMLWNVWLSLKPMSLGDLRGPSLFKFNLSLKNYIDVVKDPEFGAIFLVTIIYSLFGSGLSILIGLAAALLVHGDFKGRSILRGLFISPYIAPVVAVTFTWSFILDPQLGVLNWLAVEKGILAQPLAFLSQKWWVVSAGFIKIKIPLALSTVILFEGWRYFPFAFLFILARMQAIPEDLNKAAMVDGASPVQRFFKLTLPQLYLVLANLFLFRFIWTFNKFDDIFLLTRGQAGTKVLTVKVYDYAFGQFNIGASSAVAMILFFTLAVFLIFYFRFVVRGSQNIL